MFSVSFQYIGPSTYAALCVLLDIRSMAYLRLPDVLVMNEVRAIFVNGKVYMCFFYPMDVTLCFTWTYRLSSGTPVLRCHEIIAILDPVLGQ